MFSRLLGRSVRSSGDLPVFAAHSECDTVCDIKGVEALERAIGDPGQFTFRRIPKAEGLKHTEVVPEPTFNANGEKITPSNSEVSISEFEKTKEAITTFEKSIPRLLFAG
jgi:hypothetical protein